MKRIQRLTTGLLVLGMGMLVLPNHALAAPPRGKAPVLDFTQGGKSDGSHDWALGPTGAEGWIYAWKHTAEARQILVTKVAKGSPADGILQPDDVILGVGENPFNDDARIQFARAITSAEHEASMGILKILRWRAGKTESVAIQLPVLGTYSATAPYNCQKSAKIFDLGCQAIARRGLAKVSIPNSINALALLASGKEEYKYTHWDNTGTYLLAYALPLKSLRITGKGTSAVTPLSEKESDEVIAAGRGQFGKSTDAIGLIDQAIKVIETSTKSPELLSVEEFMQKHGAQTTPCSSHGSAADGAKEARAPSTGDGFAWPSAVPEDCPFPRSPTLTGIYFTGKHSDYHCGDTFYPLWASDGNLYSPWTDGTTDGVKCGSGDKPKRGGSTGHAVMMGDDPLQLTIKNTSPPKDAWARPYRGRYPCGSLVYNGIWYFGTYCLGPMGSFEHEGFIWNWPNLGPMPGFQISRDFGKTWEASPLSVEKPLFPEPRKFLGPVKMGAPHFVDFGKNMEHSPDGKAYLLGMGAEENDPHPRPCIKPGQPGTPYALNPGCTDDFKHANLSWISADQTYLARVKPSPETINDIKAYEFFAGNDANGKPVWTSDFAKIKPLLEWNNHMGCVTATYVPGLKKYLMCVTDGWPTVAKMNSYMLEADTITGPWRMVTYLKDFGEQAYFLNFPSKFISPDGKSLWLCYSANFSPGWNGVELKVNPPGGRYGLCLHEVKLTGPEGHKSEINQNSLKRP